MKEGEGKKIIGPASEPSGLGGRRAMTSLSEGVLREGRRRSTDLGGGGCGDEDGCNGNGNCDDNKDE